MLYHFIYFRTQKHKKTIKIEWYIKKKYICAKKKKYILKKIKIENIYIVFLKR